MRSSRNRLTITAVAFILGLLVVAQLRSQAADPGLSSQSAQDLTLLVANLNTRNQQLRDEIATLEGQRKDLADTRSRGEGAAGQLRSDLGRIQGWSGLRDVDGPGISIRISGPIGGDGVEDLLNELRNGGAEAIAVEDVRVVPGTVVAGPPGELSIENTALASGFEVRAIGSPQILTGSLTRAGGIIAQLSVRFPDAVISVTPLDDVMIPASGRDLTPVHGQPSL